MLAGKFFDAVHVFRELAEVLVGDRNGPHFPHARRIKLLLAIQLRQVFNATRDAVGTGSAGEVGNPNNYLKTFKFYETYKDRENFGEFSYLVKKFTLAAVGTLGPLKDYQAPPAGGPGGEGPPPDGSEVSFFQTMQSIRK